MNINEEVDSLLLSSYRLALDFRGLASLMRGINPIYILESLNRLYLSHKIGSEIFSHFSGSANSPNSDNEHYNKRLPVPHLHDYDWRFSNNGIQAISKYVESVINRGNVKTVVCLGCPTIFGHYQKNPKNDVEFYLIDFNAHKHFPHDDSLNSHCIKDCNVNYDFSDHTDACSIFADIIIMDPPWYMEYYKKFFDICRSICSDHCSVITALPSNLTRDTVEDENVELINYLLRNGYYNICLHNNAVSYDTPPFERNVLSAYNIRNYPSDWRYGNVLTADMSSRSELSPGSNRLSPVFRSWFEKSIGIVRFKLTQEYPSETSDTLISLVSIFPDDIYPSFSRRYACDNKFNVWTSGNRVLMCNNIPLLSVLIEQYSNSDIIDFLHAEYGMQLDSCDISAILNARSILLDIVRRELLDYGDWAYVN